MIGKIFSIQRLCPCDGDGIRTVVFFKGCPLRCQWCQNPEGLEINEPCEEYSEQELLQEVIKDKNYFKNSNGGVTLSGGELLCQADFVVSFSKLCKQNEINVTIETSGYADKDIFKKVCLSVDEVLFDLKVLSEEDFFNYTKGHLSIVLENLFILDDLGVPFVLRCPIIGNVNTKTEHYNAIKQLIGRLNNIKRVDLLPYNKLCEAKYRKIGLEYRNNFYTPSKQELQQAKDIISNTILVEIC